jgi:protein SCO1/2
MPLALLLLAGATLARIALASVPSLPMSALDSRSLAFDEHPGAVLPAHARFIDQDDRRVDLRSLGANRPIVLVPAYFHCPNLCSVVRASLFHALEGAGAVAGRDYVLVVLSIDPSESPGDARAARARDLAAFPLPGAEVAWHYLTGQRPDIEAVTTAIGFHNRPADPPGQFIHPAGIVVLTSADTVSSYLLGVGFTPLTLRSALEQASAGRTARASAPLLLLCFHFDALTGRYSLDILKVLRLAGILCVLTLGGLLLLLLRRERRT